MGGQVGGRRECQVAAAQLRAASGSHNTGGPSRKRQRTLSPPLCCSVPVTRQVRHPRPTHLQHAVHEARVAKVVQAAQACWEAVGGQRAKAALRQRPRQLGGSQQLGRGGAALRRALLLRQRRSISSGGLGARGIGAAGTAGAAGAAAAAVLGGGHCRLQRQVKAAVKHVVGAGGAVQLSSAQVQQHGWACRGGVESGGGWEGERVVCWDSLLARQHVRRTCRICW